MNRLALVAVSALVALAGCAGRVEPVEKVVTAQVTVKERCIKSAPVRPTYQTGTGDYPGEKAASKILAEDFEKAEQYGTDWEAAAAGCLLLPSGH